MCRLGPFGLLSLFLLGACATDEARPPVARIQLNPAYVPMGDHFTTPVVLDGSASADEIEDPSASHPLRFQWELPADQVMLQTGDVDQQRLTVLVRGDRPIAVKLTVTSASHETASATREIGITIK